MKEHAESAVVTILPCRMSNGTHKRNCCSRLRSQRRKISDHWSKCRRSRKRRGRSWRLKSPTRELSFDDIRRGACPTPLHSPVLMISLLRSMMMRRHVSASNLSHLGSLVALQIPYSRHAPLRVYQLSIRTRSQANRMQHCKRSALCAQRTKEQVAVQQSDRGRLLLR